MNKQMFACVILLASPIAYSSKLTISFGNKGFDVPAESVVGINTDKAVAKGTIKPEVIAEYCRGWSENESDLARCKTDNLAEIGGQEVEIRADCIKRIITTISGKKYKYLGPTTRDGWQDQEQDWQDIADNKIIQSCMACGYFEVTRIFGTLCPLADKQIAKDVKKARARLEKLAEAKNKEARPFTISIFSMSTKHFYRIVMAVKRTAKIKCVVYGANNKPLGVESFNVSPPAEELLMKVMAPDSIVKNVKCFEK